MRIVSKEIMENRSESGEASRPRLQLPASCDPPVPNGPTKQLVWIVCPSFLSLCIKITKQSSLQN